MKKSTALAAAALAAAMLCQGAYAEQPAAPLFGSETTSVIHPEWMKNAVIYEVNLRQGTPERNLKGMQAQLPRLRNLGVDIIWLMPIHPISKLNRKGTLGSYYAVADYKAVNPEFGTMEDMKEFVKTAHDLGMKVIIDEVCNHSGCDNPWTKSNPDFYVRDAKKKFVSPYDWTDTYKLDYSNPALRRAMTDALKFWVREADIDGYRFDVAFEVPTDFWDQLRTELQAIKPVFMLAEASKPELTRKAFDADYNWPMKDAFNAIAATQGVNSHAKAKNQKLPATDASAITALVEKQKKEYPRGAASMNMITNHDLNSWEGTEFERLGPAADAFAVLSFTLPGMPMLYTGQEVGFNHAFEFFETDPVQPDYTPNRHTAFYRRLTELKHYNPALDAGTDGGTFTEIPVSDPNVLAFERAKGGLRVVVIANLSAAARPISLEADPKIEGMTEWFSKRPMPLPATLKPWQYLVYTTVAN